MTTRSPSRTRAPIQRDADSVKSAVSSRTQTLKASDSSAPAANNPASAPARRTRRHAIREPPTAVNDASSSHTGVKTRGPCSWGSVSIIGRLTSTARPAKARAGRRSAPLCPPPELWRRDQDRGISNTEQAPHSEHQYAPGEGPPHGEWNGDRTGADRRVPHVPERIGHDGEDAVCQRNRRASAPPGHRMKIVSRTRKTTLLTTMARRR